ncbi:hypothetical protein MKW94_026331 [Papaver nudicaule]|uniref:DCD domain-containing protein n=1 Tax=Papaver nudicaule TaxID=74823 RepID=A0AA42B191_PAPNU|nr:hypothetical protein [Papaver nudicaule]
MRKCVSRLPSTHFSYIKNIKPGLPLFLFNYSARQLFGVYEAAGNWELHINPYGWCENGQEQTQYPAQVRFCIRKECKPLLEYQYRPILEDNYYTDDHFWFELDHAQTGQLIFKFESSPLVVSKVVSKYSWSAPKQRRNLNMIRKFKCEDSWETVSDSIVIVPQINQQEVGIESQEDSGSSDSEHDTPWDERTGFVLGSSSATPCEDENNQNLEPDSDKVEEENEEELVYRKLLPLVNEREKENCDSMGDKESAGLLCDLNGQEVEEVKVKRHQKTSQLEMKLTKAEIQVQQLTERVKELELQLIPSTASVKYLETRSADTMYMEEFPGDSKMVYFFGGCNGAAWLSTTANELIPFICCSCCPLWSHLRIWWWRCAAAELNGAIYAAGGYDGEDYLKSVERFDPREVVSWSSIPSMNFRRGYALGGYNGLNMVSSVEEFDPRNNSWVRGDKMTEARGYSTAAVIGESIYVISGLKDRKVLTETVECYKEGQGWSVANVKGACKRCFFSSILMEDAAV